MPVRDIDRSAPPAGLPATAGGMLGTLASIIAAPVIGSWSSVAARAARMQSNKDFPNQPPAPEDLIKAYYAGIMPHAQFEEALLWSGGIPISPHPRDANLSYHWRAVIEASRPQPPITLAMEMWLRGWLSDGNFDNLLTRNGLIDPKVHAYMRQRSEQLGPGDLIRLLNQGLISEELCRFLLARIGWQDEQLQGLLIKDSLAPSPGQIIEALNRGLIDVPMSQGLLTAGGLKDPDWQAMVLELRKQIPGAADLVRFALRDAWDQRIVDLYGYDAEFPPELQYWMDKQGFGWGADVPLPDGSTRPGVPWPVLTWRSHWQPISPTQSNVALHRFREDNIDKWREQVPGLEPWSIAKSRDILKIADYPVGLRDYLIASSYAVLGRIDVRRMHAVGVITDAELPGKYQDQGYTLQDATLLAEFTRKTSAKAGGDKLQKCLLGLYDVGGIEREQAKTALVDLGQTADQAERALVIVDSCSLTSTLKVAVAAVRKSYLRGELSEAQSAQRLRAAGIVESGISYYLTRWRLEFTPRRKQLSTSQVLNAYERGYIGQTEAGQRLLNLGWDQPDAVIHLTEAARIMAERAAKAVEAQEASKRKQAQELERLVKQADQQKRALIQELNRVEPLAMLKRLAKDGDISKEQFDAALEARFIPSSSRAKWIEDVYDEGPVENGEAENEP